MKLSPEQLAEIERMVIREKKELGSALFRRPYDRNLQRTKSLLDAMHLLVEHIRSVTVPSLDLAQRQAIDVEGGPV